MLTCIDTSEEKRRVAGGEIPLGTVAETVAGSHGFPLSTGGIGNASAGSSTVNVSRAYFRVKGREKYGCGVELRVIRVKSEPEDEEHALQLTDNAPKTERSRTLGAEDEDVDPDSLPLQVNLDILSDEDWDVLLCEIPARPVVKLQL
jgi:hypothetical protein